MRVAKVVPDVISYSAATSACGKGGEWQQALSLISQMRLATVKPDGFTYSAGISACETGEQWQRALALIREMRETKLEPDANTYSAGISACEKASCANGLAVGGVFLLPGPGWGRS
ncbi:unnamed protein product [Prorocentrum cordatum]|uniref:Uncharacterized protein n=1 Tax=Prorocentrum cordatum TaxID=2364126 RepID=A0ABN9RNF6_9DINO|nr:unnamed protein product [Polarella glacialis]